MLTGKRTYLVAVAMVIAGGLYQQGYITEETLHMLEALLTGAGLAALRAGMKGK
jgi:hypothetical protein